MHTNVGTQKKVKTSTSFVVIKLFTNINKIRRPSGISNELQVSTLALTLTSCPRLHDFINLYLYVSVGRCKLGLNTKTYTITIVVLGS